MATYCDVDNFRKRHDADILNYIHEHQRLKSANASLTRQLEELKAYKADACIRFVRVVRQRDKAEARVKELEGEIKEWRRQFKMDDGTIKCLEARLDACMKALREVSRKLKKGASRWPNLAVMLNDINADIAKALDGAPDAVSDMDSRKHSSLWPHLAQARREKRGAEADLAAARELLSDCEAQIIVLEMNNTNPILDRIKAFRDGQAPKPSRAELVEDNATLREEVSRVHGKLSRVQSRQYGLEVLLKRAGLTCDDNTKRDIDTALSAEEENDG